MTSEQQRGDYSEWRYWKHWSTWQKVSSVGVVLILLLSHLFFNYILPKLAAKEAQAGRSAATSPANIQIPKPNVSIPPNPNTRP